MLVGASEPTGALVCAGLLGAAFGWGGVIQSRLMDSFAVEERVIGFGLVRMVYMLVGSTGSAVTSAPADGYGWTVAFGVILSFMLLAALTLPRTASSRRVYEDATARVRAP